MDRKQLLGLILIFGLFYLWSTMNTQSRKAIEDEQRIEDSISLAQAPPIETIDIPAQSNTTSTTSAPIQNDTISNLQMAYQFGAFAPSATGTAQDYRLENEKFIINFTSKGGAIKNVLLKDYNKMTLQEDNSELKTKLYLLEDEKNKFNFEIPLNGVPGNVVKSSDLYFNGNVKGNTITFKADAGDGAFFEQIYTVNSENYDIDYSIRLVGLDRQITSGTDEIKLNWINYLDKIERNFKFEKFYSTVYFKEVDEDSDYCNCRKDAEENAEGKKIEWVSNSNQFFNTSLIAKTEPFSGAIVTTEMMEDTDVDLKKLSSDIRIPYTASSDFRYDMSMYLGPNDFNILKSYENGLQEIIPFGRSIFGTINRHLIRPMFNFLDGFTGNKGIAIILMIFLIKLVLYPLTYKMLYSQAKMGALKPEIAKIKDKHKDDAQGAQVENMKLYREYGVSPLGGCMPMILQMPIWYALFRFFPASIDFRQEGFLWATDLSSYDVIAYLPFEIPAFGAHVSLFTILWAVSTVAYTYYSTKHVDMTANPAMKYVQYFMPLMFLFFFNNYASGLTCYMFFSNLFNIAQTIGTKKFVFNEDKIRGVLMKNKEKPKKASRFQETMQQAMKKQKAAQDQKRKPKK